MAKKQAETPQTVETPKPAKQTKKKTIKIIEVSEPESESESEEEQIIYVQKPAKKTQEKKAPVKKAPAKKPKPQPVYESEEEDEAPPAKTILKPRKQKAQAQPLAPEPPKILFRFL